VRHSEKNLLVCSIVHGSLVSGILAVVVEAEDDEEEVVVVEEFDCGGKLGMYTGGTNDEAWGFSFGYRGFK